MSAAIAPARLLILMPWGRVGSNWLLMMLKDSFPETATRWRNEPFILKQDPAAQMAILSGHYAADDPEIELIGCKSSIRVVTDLDMLARQSERLGLSIVRHRRDNLIKVAVSVIRGRRYAERTKERYGRQIWGVLKGDDPLPPVDIDPDEFVRALRNVVKTDEALRSFTPECPIYDLEYRKLKGDPDGVKDEILGWLGIAAQCPSKARFSKATPDSLATAVPNLDALRGATREAGYGELDGMFDA